jgi:ubiquinone/menaquinone biosynthesis C-methylase UbiE
MKKPIYNQIGIGYDTTRKADPEITRRLYNNLQVFDHKKVIDIACGSGNYTNALFDLGINISGSDISMEMLNKAKQKNDRIEWREADVISLPFDNNEFFGATCILAIHHFQDLHKSFNEINRILNDGSRFVIFTSTPEQMEKYWLNEYFPDMMARSIAQMPSIDLVSDALNSSGFQILGYETFMIQPNLLDFFLYSGKYKPEIYTRPEVREGISSFAALANREEVEAGVERLEFDIKSGVFREKSLSYVSDRGDYLFVVAKKPESIV